MAAIFIYFSLMQRSCVVYCQGDSDTIRHTIGWWLSYQVTLTSVCLAVDFDNMWPWTLYTGSVGFLQHLGCATGCSVSVSWHSEGNTPADNHGSALCNTANYPQLNSSIPV